MRALIMSLVQVLTLCLAPWGRIGRLKLFLAWLCVNSVAVMVAIAVPVALPTLARHQLELEGIGRLSFMQWGAGAAIAVVVWSNFVLQVKRIRDIGFPHVAAPVVVLLSWCYAIHAQAHGAVTWMTWFWLPLGMGLWIPKNALTWRSKPAEAATEDETRRKERSMPDEFALAISTKPSIGPSIWGQKRWRPGPGEIAAGAALMAAIAFALWRHSQEESMTRQAVHAAPPAATHAAQTPAAQPQNGEATAAVPKVWVPLTKAQLSGLYSQPIVNRKWKPGSGKISEELEEFLARFSGISKEEARRQSLEQERADRFNLPRYRWEAEQGSVEAQAQLGRIYRAADAAQSLFWYWKAATNGHADSQTELGDEYRQGHRVEKDLERSEAWYELAAVHGSSLAQYEMGNIYEGGLGVPQDYSRAAKWYRLAADQGHGWSQEMLGVKYMYGNGVERDVVAAHQWLNLAAADGSTSAVKKRNELEETMTSQQIATAQRRATEWRAARRR
jgi:TPR repeat protein/uncharacterized membrane protein YhaH (DUF805 family)